MSAIDQIPVKELLNNLDAEGVHLYADGRDLKFQAVHPIDDEMRESLKKRKPEIIKALDIIQAVEEYKRDGFIQIFSAYLEESIYLARDENVASRVPDKTLPIYIESELAALKGLSLGELRTLHEAKIIFDGVIS